MNRILLSTGLLCASLTYGQTILFQDDFEGGSTNWTLNGGSGGNTWIINSEYIGYSPFVEDTPGQPIGTTGGPQSTYMHIYNASACSALSICNASFDTGTTSNQPTTLTTGIDATGYGNVVLSFIYLCAGQTGSAFGTIEYSTDNGVSWTSAGVTYNNVTTWTTASVSLPAWDNQANLKFRFRWQNASQGNDPAFAIDQIMVEGTAGVFASVSAQAPNPSQYCAFTTTPVTVNFTASGTINAGNTYTAQLSNAAGSFASPTTIGTMTSTSTGALTINGIIPNTIPSGTGYRIRVNASDPASTGTDNGVNLVVNPSPSMTILANPLDGQICQGESASLLASGANTISWSPTVGLSAPNSAATSATPTVTTVYLATGTDANGCTGTASFTVTVNDCADVEELNYNTFELSPNPSSESISIIMDPSVSIHGVEILDLSGRTIYKLTEVSEDINISKLSAGTYVVRVHSSAGMASKQLIKN